MDADEEGKEESPELNHLARNENKKEEDRSSINRIAPDVSDPLERSQVVVQVQQQQQPQGSLVCWERFLHVRSLKVLLVETDDSTRHVVAALLRNCSYEVMEAANGVQAWKILEDLTYHIDLILTEVVMPCLSGIGLLCKIMSHKTRTHIPVIMMSSHDSMGLVFKCLSKGAVDFLVKPIRKNELKNLWQHVWRRCHSSSGSGSDNGIQTQKSESVEKSDNNTGGIDEDDDESIGAGSGTQSSWTKQAVEIDSPPTVSPWDHISKCPDSTCAQVICSNAETLVNKWEPTTARRRCQKQEEQLVGVEMGNDLEIGIPRNLDLHPVPNEVTMLGTKKNNLPEIGFSKSSEHIDEEQINQNNVSSSKLEYIAANLTGVITNTTDLQLDSREFEASDHLSKFSEIDKSITETKELPSLELSLKRFRGVKDTGTSVQDDRKVLRRSDLSAFSRYITSSNVNNAFSGNVRSDSPPNSSLKVVKKDLMRNIQSDSSCNPPNQCSNEGSNNIDMGSTTRSAFTMPAVLKNKSMTTPTAKSLHPSSVPQVVLDKVHNKATTPEMAQLRDPHQEVNIQHLNIQHLHHHHDHHHHHHLFHNMQQQQLLPHHDDMSLKKLGAAAPHCGSSSLFHGRVEGIAGNYSLNGSASGSDNGSNGQNGSSTAVDARGRNIGIGDGLAGKTGSGDASRSGTGNRVDQDKIAQREAALTKFRLKRRERCFRKKVRYQNRKKLAEQRPRVRGQFAKQIAHEDTSRKSDN